MNTATETPTTAAAAATAVTSVQQTRRITCDWFRSPPTDYLSVASVVYPRGAKVALQELDESNALVNVVYYRNDARRYLPRGRQLKQEAAVTLSVYTSDVENADDESISFDMIQIHSKPLIDAIRPALASVHCPISEKVDDQIKLLNPFPELFFAQGRILETLKHGGLGAAKDKLLRALVTVMKVVLKKTNHTVRELAGQKTIDYVHLWTLFPLGSFVAHEVEHTTHLFQTLNAYVDTAIVDDKATQKKEKPQLVFEFASYGFDGYNFGMFQDTWKIGKFEGQISVSSLEYRPLKFEERYVDPMISKKAIEKGRKSLEYQSHHYCHYAGKVFSMTQREGAEQVEIGGRVVVDCLKARTHALDWWTFYCHSEPKICPVPAKRQEIFAAMRSLCIKSNGRRPTVADQEKRKQFFYAHEEYLMLLKPLVPGWSLDYNDWFWLDVSNLEPISFEQNPLGHLVIENERSLSLINKLIDTKLQNMTLQNSQQTPEKRSQCRSLLMQFSGEAGTGKTATATAIAEYHQRPLIRMSLGDLPLGSKEAKKMFAVVLELAQDWQGILAIDTATSFFETKKQAFGHDLARMLENFDGIGIFVKRDKERLLDDLVKQCQINLQFEPFSQQKRQKIWQLLVDKEREQASDDASKMQLMDEEMLRTMSSWELNGHDIRHLFNNIVLLQRANGDDSLKLEDVEDLKTITCQSAGPSKEE